MSTSSPSSRTGRETSILVPGEFVVAVGAKGETI